MIDPDMLLIFIGSCVLLGLIPGPNVSLIVANSIAHGSRYGLVSVAGTSSAMLPQLAVTILGALTLLMLVASAFEWLRWLGVGYLLYLGFKHMLSELGDNTNIEPDKKAQDYRNVYWGGFLVSVSNPKTLLFFGAYFPQFVSSEGSITSQLIFLSATFITVITLIDCSWAILAGRVRPYLLKFGRLSNVISGAFFMTSGVGLALARKP